MKAEKSGNWHDIAFRLSGMAWLLIYSIGIGGVDYRLHTISIELMGNGFVSVRVVKSFIRTPSENLNWKREKHYSQ